MSKSDCFVSLIVPLQDPGPTIDQFLTELEETIAARYQHWETLIIDDGSTSEGRATIEALLSKYQHMRLIRLTRSFGEDIAISAGLDSVIGDFVVVISADTDPPALVPRLLELCRGGADIVYGIRDSRAGEPLWSRIGSSVFYWFANSLLGVGIRENATNFRVMSRRAVNSLVAIRDRASFLRTLSSYVGFPEESVTYSVAVPLGRSAYRTPRAAFRLALHIIGTNSNRPLRIASLLSAAAAALNFAFLLYLAASWVVGGESARSAESLHIAFLGVGVFSVLAVLCEYLAQVVDEVKGRNSYFVAEERDTAQWEVPGERNVVSRSRSERR